MAAGLFQPIRRRSGLAQFPKEQVQDAKAHAGRSAIQMSISLRPRTELELYFLSLLLFFLSKTILVRMEGLRILNVNFPLHRFVAGGRQITVAGSFKRRQVGQNHYIGTASLPPPNINAGHSSFNVSVEYIYAFTI